LGQPEIKITLEIQAFITDYRKAHKTGKIDYMEFFQQGCVVQIQTCFLFCAVKISTNHKVQ